MIAQINSRTSQVEPPPASDDDGNVKTTLQQLTFDGDDHPSLSVRFKVGSSVVLRCEWFWLGARSEGSQSVCRWGVLVAVELILCIDRTERVS